MWKETKMSINVHIRSEMKTKESTVDFTAFIPISSNMIDDFNAFKAGSCGEWETFDLWDGYVKMVRILTGCSRLITWDGDTYQPVQTLHQRWGNRDLHLTVSEDQTPACWMQPESEIGILYIGHRSFTNQQGNLGSSLPQCLSSFTLACLLEDAKFVTWDGDTYQPVQTLHQWWGNRDLHLTVSEHSC